jgi:hypothetical protein
MKRFFRKKWNEFLEYGRTITDTDLAARVKTIAPNKCATLIYTVWEICFFSSTYMNVEQIQNFFFQISQKNSVLVRILPKMLQNIASSKMTLKKVK